VRGFNMSKKEQYTEYGYRGLEEVKMLQEQVEKLRKENKELKKRLKIVETNLEIRIKA
tara:strand:+ start:337 stop:510 length:174 start_codon:yes stop_codon:yes gene_type:complete